MTDNNEYDEYTKGLIEAIITAANDDSGDAVAFDTLKSKDANTFLTETFNGVFRKFLMNIGFTTPDGSALAQSTNDYFYNSIVYVKRVDENGMYLKWKNELKKKNIETINKELNIFKELQEEGKNKFISRFLIYIAFELLQYSKNKYWNNCLVKTINTNPDNKNLKQLEPMEGQLKCKLKNPKEYHPIHNGRLFIEDLFSRINKYFETAEKKIKEAIPKKESSVVPDEIVVPKKNLKNAMEIVEEIKIKLADTLRKFTNEDISTIISYIRTNKFFESSELPDEYFNAAFKRQDLLDLMKRPESNHSHVFQLDKLKKFLGNQPIGSKTQNPLHEGGRKTRRRRNIRVKSRRYH